MTKEQTVHSGFADINKSDVEELTIQESLIPIQRRTRTLRRSLFSSSDKGRSSKGFKKALLHRQSQLDEIQDDIDHYSQILEESIADCEAIKDELKFIDIADRRQFEFLNGFLRKAEDEEIPRLQAIVSGLKQELKAVSVEVKCCEGENFQRRRIGSRKVQGGSRDHKRKLAIARQMKEIRRV